MKRTHLSRIALILGLVFLGVSFTAAEDIKRIRPTGYVTDLAGVVGAETKARLETMCAEVEQKTGAQMAKYRIEVGYGLEPVINDARAGDAGRAMVPFLRQGDYSKAAEIAAWQLARYIAADSGVTLSGQQPAGRIRNDGDSGGIPGIWFLLGLILFFIVIASLSSRGGGPGGSGLLWFLLGTLLGSSQRSSGGEGWGGGGFGGGGGGGGFGGFGGGSSGGGGASGSW